MMPDKRKRSPRKTRKAPAASRFKALALEARVLAEKASADYRMTQEEFARVVDKTDRTLRDWAGRGMPVYDGPHGRPQYGSDSIQWAIAWEWKIRKSDAGRAPKRLEMEEVRRMHLARQAKEWPDGFVLVPLPWDHPMRVEQLRKAAAGISAPEDSDEEAD